MMNWGTEPGQKVYDGRDFGWNYHPMMGWMGNNPGLFWFFGIIWLVTWILIIVALIALIRWLWKKGDNGRSKRR